MPTAYGTQAVGTQPGGAGRHTVEASAQHPTQSHSSNQCAPLSRATMLVLRHLQRSSPSHRWPQRFSVLSTRVRRMRAWACVGCEGERAPVRRADGRAVAAARASCSTAARRTERLRTTADAWAARRRPAALPAVPRGPYDTTAPTAPQPRLSTSSGATGEEELQVNRHRLNRHRLRSEP